MAANPHDLIELQEPSFDFGDLLAFLWNKKVRIILLASVLIASSGYIVLKLPKIYVASSTLVLGSSAGGGLQMPSIMSLTGAGGDSKMDTYIEFMRSRQFAQIIVTELELYKTAEFSSKESKSDELEYSLDIFLAKLSLSKVRNTDMLRVKFSSYDPELAAQVVNTIGPAFFKFHVEQQQQRVFETSSRLNTQLSEIKQRLVAAESRLQAFQNDHDIIDVHTQIEMTQSETSALIKEKLLNDKKMAESQASMQQIEQLDDNEDMLLQIPWIMQNALVQDLRRQIVAQHKVLAEISKRYKSKHHRYIAEQSNLDIIQAELSSLIKQLVEGLQQSIDRQLSRRDTLNQQITNAKGQLQVLGKQELELGKLTREVETTSKVFETFTSKLHETEMLKDIGNTEDFSVVDYASVPQYPAKPNMLLSMFVVVLFSVVFSAGFWLIIHLINDNKTRYRHALRRMGVTTLASLPNEGKKHRLRAPRPLRINKGEVSYQYAEAIRALRTSVLIGPGADKAKIVAVTAVNQGEGRASVAINLAESCSNMEKVLLTDIDLSRPSIARGVGLSDKHPGITDFFDRKVKLRDCLHRENVGRLTILPGGYVPGDPLAIISRRRFVNFLQRMTDHFERIILEAPPIKTVSDALIMTQLVDAVIIVCDMEKTTLLELQETIQRLRETNAPLLGVVFNRVKK